LSAASLFFNIFAFYVSDYDLKKAWHFVILKSPKKSGPNDISRIMTLGRNLLKREILKCYMSF
jgi:hypothetical protein